MKGLKKVVTVLVLTLVCTVFAASVTSIEAEAAAKKPKLNKTKISMKAGQSSSLKAKGSKIKKVTWKTSKKSVATVNSKGVVKAKNNGSAKITAKVKSGKKTYTITCKVNVVKTTSAMENKSKQNMQTYAQFMNEVVKYTNEYRQAHGLKPVKADSTLNLVASYRSVEMAQRDILSHTRPDGSKFYDLAKKYGVSYSIIGENIGCYQEDAKEIVDDWYNSPGHRANMLNGKYSKIGVGVAMTSDGYLFWTQIFKN